MENSYRVSLAATQNEFPQFQACNKYFNKLIPGVFEIGSIWIAGGAIRDFLEKGYVDSDIDFYSSNRSDLFRLVRFLRKEFQFKHYLITQNAIKGNVIIKGKKIMVDVVKRTFDDMIQTISMFDFTVTCFATNGNDVYYHPSAPFDLLRKRLVINNLPFPISTLQRMQKYIQKGYWICNGGMLEIAKSMGAIDFDSADENTIEFYPDGSPRFVRFD